jgi:hypothetical protein
MPRLEKLLAKQQQRTHQTWREQMAIMSLWAAVMRRAQPVERE